MIQVRRTSERGATRLAWLESYHTFSFGDYYDPHQMGFGPLRVINEDRVAPGGGFPTHSHANMEIVTYVLEGALAHKDSLGTGSTIRPGDVQHMSAGVGIAHSEFNASRDEPVHFLQIWIQPDRLNIPASYGQQAYPREEREGRLRVVASPDGREGSLRIQQDASMYSTVLAVGRQVAHAVAPARRAWVQVARGRVALNGIDLGTGDGAGIEGEANLVLEGVEDAEVLLFDLPALIK